MKKLVLGAAIVVALSGTAAHAAITVDANGVPVINPADTNILYLSGASAAEKFIEKVLTDVSVPAVDKICDTSKKMYKFQDPAATSQFAYLCERATGNSALPSNKANILIYKRSAGGSAYGVSPIVAEANGNIAASTIEFLKISSACTVTTAAGAGALTKVSCAYDPLDSTKFVSHTPDFGISDVDPAQFSGENAPINPDSGVAFDNITTADVGKLNIASASALTFGVPVTKNLYFALQAAQKSIGTVPATCVIGDETEACMPSLSSEQVASIHAGNIADWNQFKVGTVGLYDWVNTPANGASAYLPGASALHTCRRENGSGTQAQSNIKFLGNPCAGSAAISATADTAIVGTGEGEGSPLVHENNSSGNVDVCLNELQDGTNAANSFDNTYGVRWAVGIQSLEKSTAAATKYRFVKLDGVAPTLANVVKGKYRDWAENTFQYSKTHVFSSNSTENTALKALTNAVIKSAGLPEVMAALNNGFTHTFTTAKGAYLAVPTVYAPEANGAFLATRPVNPFSHGSSTSKPNNCRVPTIYNNGSVGSGDTGL